MENSMLPQGFIYAGLLRLYIRIPFHKQPENTKQRRKNV